MSYFTELDCYLFGQATHYDIYHKMGAHVMTMNRKKGVCFDVWAPHAKEVFVIGDFNNWDETSHEMQRVEPEEMGVYELFIPGVEANAMYKYLIIGEDGSKNYKADPYATYAQLRPETASIVYDTNHFKWSDDAWMKERRERERKMFLDSPWRFMRSTPVPGCVTPVGKMMAFTHIVIWQRLWLNM